MSHYCAHNFFEDYVYLFVCDAGNRLTDSGYIMQRIGDATQSSWESMQRSWDSMRSQENTSIFPCNADKEEADMIPDSQLTDILS